MAHPGLSPEDSLHDEERTFHGFAKLPVELRLLILDAFIHFPRVITVYRENKFVKAKGPRVSKSSYRIPYAMVKHCDVEIPILLHINKEFREYASTFYSLAFEGRLKKPIYFNFAVDYIHYYDISAVEALDNPRPELHWGPTKTSDTSQSLQRLIIGRPTAYCKHSYSMRGNYVKTLRTVVRNYKGLNDLILEAPSYGDIGKGWGRIILPRLSKILKPSTSMPGTSIPQNVHLVSHCRLNSMFQENVSAFVYCDCDNEQKGKCRGEEDERIAHDESDEEGSEDGESEDEDTDDEGDEDLVEYDDNMDWYMCLRHQQKEDETNALEAVEQEDEPNVETDFE
ncbi:uncharacterized protein RAG0_07994 [Rhynchosporium agropyri]|uniref:2EXR domain-containing protein n=1 Tax=Rhynchosporium agropyri TaxID=914238 RepID=A0A1E1KNU0_9HELO|nr:uncharacterized protein RAG0_07994 [Rhynchosporium agropyri]